MNEKDKLRFARYYAGYIEKEIISDNAIINSKNNTKKTENTVNCFINKINIDKNKLINDTILINCNIQNN